MSTPTLFMGSFLLMIIYMSYVWKKARELDNYSIVDGAWALGFSILTLIYVLNGNLSLRKSTLLVMVGLWSLRLATFLFQRIKRHHPHEDSRYQTLRLQYLKARDPNVPRSFFWFFQYQGISIVLLSLPFLLIAQSPSESFSTLDLFSIGLWSLAFTGEAFADRQKTAFRSDPKNKDRVCDVGLWRYSRHPNYFFEALIWWSYFLFAVSSPYGIITVYCPLIMLVLLLKVTGVPPAEAESLRSRGEAFRKYQRETSCFIPWFPKKSDA